MIDLALEFCSAESVASAIETDSVDFKQKSPDSGLWPNELFVALAFPTVGSGAGSVTFKVQDSADDSAFADLVSVTLNGTDMVEPVFIRLPVKHRRYLRIVSTVSGTVAGTVSAHLTDKATLLPNVVKDGIAIEPTAD